MRNRRNEECKPVVPKKELLIFLTAVCRIVTVKAGIHKPGQVENHHIDEVYSYMWATDELKFATEIYVEPDTIAKYLWEATERNMVTA